MSCVASQSERLLRSSRTQWSENKAPPTPFRLPSCTGKGRRNPAKSARLENLQFEALCVGVLSQGFPLFARSPTVWPIFKLIATLLSAWNIKSPKYPSLLDEKKKTSSAGSFTLALDLCLSCTIRLQNVLYILELIFFGVFPNLSSLPTTLWCFLLPTSQPMKSVRK